MGAEMSLQSFTRCIPESSVFHDIAFSSLESEPLRLGYEYWKSKCGGRRFPAREDIRPREIAPLLRYVSLIKVDGDDFVYRIVGDTIVMSYGVPLQNRRLSDLVYDEPGFGAFVIPFLRQVADTGEPLARRGKVGRDVTRVNFTHCENLLLPLGADDATVDYVLTFSSYVSQPLG
jgi:hypothetical protein